MLDIFIHRKKGRTWRGLCALLTVPVLSLSAAMPGDGTLEDPYQVSTIADLQAIANDLNAHYVLVNDIDASETADWNVASGGPKGFAPIGSIAWQQRFRGSLDGQGYLIHDLYINRPAEARVGLFGYIEAGASVQRLGLVNVTVIGGQRTGALTGENHGTISRVFSTGYVQGAWATGGLVGENHLLGVIEDAYSHATVQVSGYGGGLIGANLGTVRHAFSSGSVEGPGWAVGGSIGQFSGGSVEEVYWDVEVSGLTTSAAGIGKTTAEMFDILTFASLDIADPEQYDGQTWIIEPGESYPSFGWVYYADAPEPDDPGETIEPFFVRGRRVVERVIVAASDDDTRRAAAGQIIARVRLEWEVPEDNTPPNRPFLIKRATDLARGDWRVVAVVQAQSGLNAWTSPDALGDDRVYYRVVFPGPGVQY